MDIHIDVGISLDPCIDLNEVYLDVIDEIQCVTGLTFATNFLGDKVDKVLFCTLMDKSVARSTT